MKFGLFGAYDIALFNKNGKKITTLDTNKETSLQFFEREKSYLGVKDALLDVNLLTNIGEEIIYDDYNKEINDLMVEIVFGNQRGNREFKIIAKGTIRNLDHNDKEVIIEIPKAKYISNFSIFTESEDTTDFDYLFEILPFNEKEDYFKIKIKE